MNPNAPLNAEAFERLLEDIERTSFQHRRVNELVARAAKTLPGALHGVDPTALMRALRLLERYRRTGEDVASVAALWMRPTCGVGEALFPVEHGGEGHVFAIRVGRHAKFLAPAPCDAAFKGAVEQARDWFFTQEGDRLSWTVFPMPEIPLTGTSVFAAAVVAWQSLYFTVPPNLGGEPVAWTGSPDLSQGTLKVGTVAQRSLSAKYRAVRNMGLKALFAPARQCDAEPFPLHGITGLAEIVQHAFGTEPRRGESERAPLVVRDLPRAALRALYVLLAADAPLSDEELRTAVFHAGWSLPVDGDAPALDVAVPPLRQAGLVAHVQGGWIARRDASSALGYDPQLRREAHLALAEAYAQEEARAAHRWLAPRSTAEAPPSLSTDLQRVGPAYALLQRLAAIRESEAWVGERLCVVPHDSVGGVARLAWEARALGGVFASVARRIFEAQDTADVLFSLQALAETLLHTLAAAAVELRACTAQEVEELERRPSVGILTSATLRVTGPLGVAHPVRDALREALAPVATDLQKLPSTFNEALHDRGALEKLAVGGVDASALAALVSRLGRVITALRSVLHADAFGPRGASGAWTLRARDAELPLGAAVRTGPDDGPVFFRGALEGKPRYWALHSAQTVWPAGAPWHACPPAIMAGVDRLPTPLARLVAAQQRRVDAPLRRLARIDAHLGVTLRLAWFATLAAQPELHARSLQAEAARDPSARWFAVMNHRNLWDQIRAHAAPHDPAGFLLQSPVRDAVLTVLDGLERIGHAPGPLAAHVEHVDALVPLLAALHRDAPWCAGQLLGFDGRAWWALRGIAPERAAEAPGDVTDATAGIVVLRPASQAPSLVLSPCLTFREQDLWILQKRDARSARYARVGGPPEFVFECRDPKRTGDALGW